MKQRKLAITLLLVMAAVLSIGSACKSLMSSTENTNTTKSNTAPVVAKANNNTDPGNSNAAPAAPAKVEKADFTISSEDLDKEFHKKGVTDKDLEKYASKNIAVTGRVSMLVTEKHDTTQPWVTLFAPGIGRGVSCYFDDDNVDQMKMLKEDKVVKVQGFQSDLVVPEVSPMLKHCVVLEAN